MSGSVKALARLAVVSALVAGGVSPVAANLILNAPNLVANAGSAGSFDLTLENTGPAAVTIGAYQLQLRVDGSGVRFTGVDRDTIVPSIFPGASGPLSSDFDPPAVPPITLFTASDFAADPLNGATIGAGEVGLLRVFYAIDAGATGGTRSVEFVLPGTDPTDLTQLADPDGNLLEFKAVGGSVTIVTAVPEPASLVLLGSAGAAVLAGYVLRRSGRAGLRRTCRGGPGKGVNP